MRSATVAIAAGVVVILAIAALYLRPSVEPEPPSTRPAAPRPVAQGGAAKPAERSARVEERLGQLREEFERKQAGIAKVEPNRREVPTMAPRQREELGEGGSDDLDDEDPDEMRQLKQTLLTDPDPEERIGAVLMLTGEEGPESLRMLLDAMDDPDPEVRLAVVEALGDRSEDITPDILTPALRDPDPEVRFEAVSILGDMDSPEARQMVRSATKDEDEDVRALAEGIEDFADDDDDGDIVVPTPRQNAHAQR